MASYLTNQLNISAVQLVSGFLRIMNHWKVNNDPKQHIFCPIFSEKVESAMDKLMDKTRIFLFLFFLLLGGPVKHFLVLLSESEFWFFCSGFTSCDTVRLTSDKVDKFICTLS